MWDELNENSLKTCYKDKDKERFLEVAKEKSANYKEEP